MFHMYVFLDELKKRKYNEPQHHSSVCYFGKDSFFLHDYVVS
jgi:hypothetical protein